MPTNCIVELVKLVCLTLFFGRIFKDREMFKRTDMCFAVFGGNANTGILKPNFCNFFHNMQHYLPQTVPIS